MSGMGKKVFGFWYYLMKTGFFCKRNSKLCHTCINVIITSKEMWVPAAHHHQ
jgi:hypothetical protein